MAQRILMVDDDTRLTAMLADYLAPAGLMLEARATAREGMATLHRATLHGDGYDVLILDLMLPEAEGFDVCRQGLGLALVRQIATRHGGTVRCEPREGGGTCFVVELERLNEQAS